GAFVQPSPSSAQSLERFQDGVMFRQRPHPRLRALPRSHIKDSLMLKPDVMAEVRITALVALIGDQILQRLAKMPPCIRSGFSSSHPLRGVETKTFVLVTRHTSFP